MLILKTASKNIFRHGLKSLLFFFFCTVLFVAFMTYMVTLDQTRKELDKLSSSLPVYGQICSLNGDTVDHLQISRENIKGLNESQHLKDPVYSGSIQVTVEDLPSEQMQIENSLAGLATNTVRALPAVAAEDVVWTDSIGEGILAEDDQVCLVEQTVMERNGWSLGEQVELYVHYLVWNRYEISTYERSLPEQFRIVGSYPPAAAESGQEGVLLLFPYQTVFNLYQQQGLKYYMESANFYIDDPLELNDFKAEMKEVGFLSLVANAQYSSKGNSLYIEDSVYINAASSLQDNIRLLQMFLPYLLLVMIFISYLLSFLLIQDRREEYVAFRVAGMRKRSVFGTYFTEFLLIAAAAGCISTAVGILVVNGEMTVGIKSAGLFLLSNMLGVSIALMRLGRTNLMTALQKTD